MGNSAFAAGFKMSAAPPGAPLGRHSYKSVREIAPPFAWHAPCDLRPAGRRRAGHAGQTEDIAMFNPTGAAGRPRGRRGLAATAGLAFGLLAAIPARAEDTIKIGILHSLSGTMAISE